MGKREKNILIIFIMIVMMICSYFTILKINNRVVIDNINMQKEININDDNKTVNEETNQDEIIDSNSSETKTRTKRDKNNRGFDSNKRLPNRNENTFPLIKDHSIQHNNTLYIILFSIESMIFGSSILYLFLLNTNKLKNNK